MNDRERNQSGQEQAVKQFLRDFLDKTKDEQTMNRILQDVGGYYDADRAYIFEMDKCTPPFKSSRNIRRYSST